MPSNVAVNPFSQVPQAEISRSIFDRSHGYKTTLDADYLYPILFDEILPGDTIELRPTLFARLATQVVPFMDNCYIDFHLWFVPVRLLWQNFKKFMGERVNPNDSIDFVVPQIVAGDDGFSRYGLMDYLSIPPAIKGLSVSAFFSRAYNLIYNEWYRDENLQDSVHLDLDDGPDDPVNYVLLKRGKRGDYFTTCLPQPQKGASVEVPLGATAPLYGNTVAITGSGTSGPLLASLSDSTTSFNRQFVNGSGTTHVQYLSDTIVPTSFKNGRIEGAYVDLTEATAVTVNSLRQAVALQQFFERDMRGGTRYIELVLSHFGVLSPDARLQRPEFLASFTSALNQNTVAQTSQTTQGTTGSPQANLAAYSMFSVSQDGFYSKSFTEHGVLLGLATIRSDLTYQQGIDRMFSRKTRYDYFWPDLAHLGEQEVLEKEIYATGDSANDDAVFGYQERYAEYRYKNSYITGKLRSTDPQSLDVWHLSQYFENAPKLNSDFITQNTPMERVIAVQDEPQFILDAHFDYYHIRPIPLYGIPGLRRL